jgi:hypothetical protein
VGLIPPAGTPEFPPITPPAVGAFSSPAAGLLGGTTLCPAAFRLGYPVPAAPLPAGSFDPGAPPPTLPAGGPPPTLPAGSAADRCAAHARSPRAAAGRSRAGSSSASAASLSKSQAVR